MKLSGRSIIGFQSGAVMKEVFNALNPKSGERLEPGFFAASPDEVDRAVSLARQAFATYDRVSARDRGAFLRTIAANIESIAEELVERAEEETALPKPVPPFATNRRSGGCRFERT